MHFLPLGSAIVWPIVSGCNRRVAELPGGLAIILDHTGAYPPS
jgi:hypothetical protein